MDSDEREIFNFLKTRGAEFVSYREIARRAGGKTRYHRNPDWAKPLLSRMQERGILDHDAQGRFRIKPVAGKGKAARWVSPDIAKLLKEKGVQIHGSDAHHIASEEYYDAL